MHLNGSFFVSRAAAEHYRKQESGSFVHISSTSGLIGNFGQANYSASKAGLVGLTRTVAKELAGRKVTVNAVAPGFIASEMTDALGPMLLDEVKKRVPAKRLGEAWEIADRGPGIPAAVAEHLFEPFVSRRAGGTGLGLFIARELASCNGASLLHEPRAGGGTVFRVVFADPQRWEA